MNFEEAPPWSKNQLRRLGEALLKKCAPPAGRPDYNAVMLWHNDLASAIADVIKSTLWESQRVSEFAVAARSRTVDTLVQKLERSTLKLDCVQDLAGVRIDADVNLTPQTQLAAEIAAHLGTDRVIIRDLRQQPHSGYRAVHLWLVLPAGRVEIQIRTIYQSLWANVYEGLADLVGRGIRYDQTPDNPAIAEIVELMHAVSADIARDERVADQPENVLDELVDEFLNQTVAAEANMLARPESIDRAFDILSSDVGVRLRQTADQLRDLRRILGS